MRGLSRVTAAMLARQIAGVLMRDGTIDRRVPLCLDGNDTPRSSGAAVVDVSDLSRGADGGDFIREAFTRIFGRPPLQNEITEYVRLSQQCAPAYVVSRMVTAASASSPGTEFRGVWVRQTARELAALTGPSLIRAAFRSVLWRDPTDAEYLRYLYIAARAGSREDFLLALASVPEASAYPRLPGLPVELSELQAVKGTESFVRRAYELVLGRTADPSGYAAAVRALRWIARKRFVRLMAESPEAASRGIKFLWRGRPISSPPKWRVLLQPAQVAKSISSYAASLAEPVIFAFLHATQGDIRRDITESREHFAAALQTHHQGLEASIDAVRVRAADIQQSTLQTTQRLDGIVLAAQQQVTHISAQAQRLDAIVLAAQQQAAHISAQTERLDAIVLAAQQQAEHTAAHTVRLDTLVAQHAAGLELTRDVQVRTTAISVPVGDRLLVSRVHGYVMAMPAEDVMLASLLTMYGSVDAGLVAFFARVLQPGMTFVDVGAHIGIHTLAAATHVADTGRVYSFEPAPRMFDILTTNLALNNLSGRVTAYRQAVSDHAGVAQMIVRVSSGLSSLYGTPQESDAITEVPLTTLDEALAGVDSVDYVKIDAEGAEPAIVLGATSLLRRNPQMRLVLEFAPPLLQRAGIEPARFALELMNAFTLRRIDDVSGEPHDIAPELLTGIESSNILLEQR